MTLRTRLIFAFFVLSVIPLGAVTVYSYTAYTANVEALRNVTERDSDRGVGGRYRRREAAPAIDAATPGVVRRVANDVVGAVDLRRRSTLAGGLGSAERLRIARSLRDSLADLRRTWARTAWFSLLCIGVALVGIVPLSVRLTRNLGTLGEAVGRMEQGDYHARVPVRSNDEIGRLARTLNQMAFDVERHRRAAVTQERIRSELELGRLIQGELVPRTPLTCGLVDVRGASFPAREVGGDFFNYFVVDGGQIALVMGDVSGKGVGAALLMANIQGSLATRLGLTPSLAAVVAALDRDLECNSPDHMYATLFIGLLDPGTRQLRYVNAGHNPQYVVHAGGGFERLSATGLPVGLLAGRGYTEECLELAAGDLLFCYTDGCLDMENDKREPFGSERLETLLQEVVGTADPWERIEKTLDAFRGTSEPFDDAALMTVKIG